jgi:hypothetical protein
MRRMTMETPSIEDLRRVKRRELVETVLVLACKNRILTLYHPIQTDDLTRDILWIHDIPTLEGILDALFGMIELLEVPPPWIADQKND